MELNSNERRWVDVKYIQHVLSVGKTKAHQIAHQIADEDEDPEAVIKFGRCLRISEDALIRWIKRHRYPRDLVLLHVDGP